MLGVKSVPIEFGVNGKRRSLRIKDLLQLQIEGTAGADANQESLVVNPAFGLIDLYYNQRKNVRQIAQEARMSFRDIAAILKKKEAAAVNDGSSGTGNGIVAMDNQQQQIGNGSSWSNQKSTQAYKLFSEGKKPVGLAIQLCLSEKKATRYYREYWELEGLYELTLLYEERKHYLPSFLKLHNIREREGIDNENDIANVLKYAKELPNLQQYWENLS